MNTRSNIHYFINFTKKKIKQQQKLNHLVFSYQTGSLMQAVVLLQFNYNWFSEVYPGLFTCDKLILTPSITLNFCER